jgi:type I restriction-modification system DNA methylase subunit
MRLTFADAQRNVAEIANRQSYSKDVIFELLAAYGRSASAITKLRTGSLNLAPNTDTEVLQRGVVYFKHIPDGSLHAVIDSLDQDPLVVRYNPRYLIATDYDQLVAKDTKKDTTLDIKLRDIDRNVDFFYGWTGDEVTSEKTEAIADRRAADKMKDLYAEIEIVNRDKLADPKSTFRHDLNVFFSRLLFCFFAEDTKVFSKEDTNIFTGSIKDYTQTDGHDLDTFLATLFDALDTEDKSELTSPYSKFPYVNGTIFDTKKHNIAIPKFNAQARKLILDCGNQNWAEINPDIFGSMFQSIVDEEHRANNGMHYTSVPNIMKTIEPLFIDELREEFDKNYDDPKKLNKQWDRVSKIKVFDPACGSGNFLIIAYKELRKIEHGIIDRLFSDDYKRAMLSGRLESRIKLDNFYGIEIDDFAHEIAILSLYLAKHQMNIEFEEHFGKEIVLIPLKDNAKIVQGNAAKLDWHMVCPNVQKTMVDSALPQQSTLIELDVPQSKLSLEVNDWDEIYLIGNPPYVGAKLQDKSQKLDFEFEFQGKPVSKNLDYIAIWFLKGSEYIAGTKAKLSFVTTNSICQGEQVAMLWPHIFNLDLEIKFAQSSFKWSNNARDGAGVFCNIIALQTTSDDSKYIYDLGIRRQVTNINAYLVEGSSLVIKPSKSQVSGLPDMLLGSSGIDGGHLVLTPDEKDLFVSSDPRASAFIKKYVGGSDFINGVERYCLWIDDDKVDEALSIALINERVEKCKQFRLKAGRDAKKAASVPHRFFYRKYKDSQAIILPMTSSERRDYIPVGFENSGTVVSNGVFTVYDAQLWIFAILTSRMHMVWAKSTAGKLETRIRYSNTIVYNNLVVPNLSSNQKQQLTASARAILFAREGHSERTIADMYDPDKMPVDLRDAHINNDLIVDKLYQSKPYSSDDERLANLFSLYEQNTVIKMEKRK